MATHRKNTIQMNWNNVLKISDDEVRNILADIVAVDHGNPEFVRQIRNGEQDDNWFLKVSFAVRDKLQSKQDG
jgi:hypothetical protein